MFPTVVDSQRGLRAAKYGVAEAREAVAKRLWQRLRSMACYYARRTGEDGDDLLSEAWLGLLEGLDAVDLAIGDPEQYLLKRARWRMLDHIKRARVRRLECLDPESANLRAAPEHDRRLNALATAGFLAQLNDTQRAIAECLLDGLTWRETGAVLGCSSANVAYHMRRIREIYSTWCGAQ